MAKTIAENSKQRYAALRAQGKCPRCSTKLRVAEKNAGNTYCEICRDYLSERARERAAGRKLREIAPAGEGPVTFAESKAQQRQRAREAGLCSICTTQKTGKGRSTCDECVQRAKQYRHKSLEKH